MNSWEKAANKLKTKLAGVCREEFLQLEQEEEEEASKYSFSIASLELHRNRYYNVLPYDHNIVRLMDGGYVNASRLRNREGDVHYTFIATQGPLKNTRDDFWQMVIEQNASAVIMLTNWTENGTSKCSSYFAPCAGTRKHLDRYAVNTESVVDLTPGLVHRTIGVCSLDSGERRAVPHFHYTAWPDHRVPDEVESLFTLSSELSKRDAHSSPIVIHCSAGIGRSGVFCVLDIMARRLKKGSEIGAEEVDIDIYQLVSNLRKQRAGMVQTEEQYMFCHTALLQYIEKEASVTY